MKKRKHVKLVHEGNYVAEVDIELCDSGEGWAPYLSLNELNIILFNKIKLLMNM